MKQHAMMVVLSKGLLFLTDVMAQSSPATVATVHASPDARRLRTGHFTYRILDHGKNVGTGTITIQKIPNSGNYAFAAEFSGYADQKWESIATSAFEPVSATLSFGKATSSTPAFALKYTGRRVTGFAISRKKSDLGIRRSIDAALPANTVDQRIDWAAVLASHLKPDSNSSSTYMTRAPALAVSSLKLDLSNESRFRLEPSMRTGSCIGSRRLERLNSIRCWRAGIAPV